MSTHTWDSSSSAPNSVACTIRSPIFEPIFEATLLASSESVTLRADLACAASAHGEVGRVPLEAKWQFAVANVWIDFERGFRTNPDPQLKYDSRMGMIVAKPGLLVFDSTKSGLRINERYPIRLLIRLLRSGHEASVGGEVSVSRL